MFATKLFLALMAVASAVAHPVHQRQSRDIRIVGRTHSAVQPARRADHLSEFEVLIEGNKQFRAEVEAQDPGLLKKLTDDGQAPPFMFIGCSDSRVSEGTVFKAKPGTFFTERNIANQFHQNDANAHTVLSYAVAELGVKHVIVMGHYGCGGVAAAIASPPHGAVDAANGAVQSWINPVRELFAQSSRPEIVELRERIKGQALIEEPEVQEPGFRALVEENVKASVHRIVSTSVIANHYAALSGNTTAEKRAEGGPIGDVFIHGWVYDIENGEVRDLGVSLGPPGKAIPTAPFAAVAGAAEAQANAHVSAPVEHSAPPAQDNASSHESPEQRCEQLCKAKRSITRALQW